MMRIRVAILLPVFLLVMTATAASRMDNEINHILSYVAETECLFERNGTSYTGSDAVKHIIKKYEYFRSEIDSTEKFIELSASKSTMSGKYYMILCKEREAIRSRDWLLKELQNFRKKSPVL